ncbi:MgtC/SapB family protein [Ensifer sp. B1-9]|uniref:MgtC/SapB family protein n=1 Tax=Ensifer sp. B1-9 TaxID=3141455 RepID=UPI003D1CAD7E
MEPLILRLGLALAIGLLVGLERGWRERDAPEGSRTAGIRTFGISALLGGIIAAMSEAQKNQIVFAAGLLGFSMSLTWFKLREARRDEDFSVTGVVAGLCVFSLGGLAVVGDYKAAAAGGAALAAVLASRELLHNLLKRLTWVELRSALVLAVMTAIGLPLLPNRAIDPWGGFNPREIWFLTVLSATISFGGYVATRLLGRTRGLLVSGLAGAIVSSTAVTASFGQKARSGEPARPLVGAASLAAAISLLRVLVIVLALSPRLLPLILLPLLTAALVSVACGSLLLAKGVPAAGQSVDARNPFELVPLLVFVSLFAVTATLGAVLVTRIGNNSLIAISAASGIFDVDVAVLTALRSAGGTMPLETVGAAVLVAALVNAGGRIFVAMLSGSAGYWLPLGLVSLVAAAGGASAYFLTT